MAVVLIQVKAEEKEKVIGFLLTNGKFMGLPDNKFNIVEHGEEMVEKLRKAGIQPLVIT